MEQYIQKLQKSGGSASLMSNKGNSAQNTIEDPAGNKENSSLASNANNKGKLSQFKVLDKLPFVIKKHESVPPTSAIVEKPVLH
jgi:hypothetical protein